MGLILRLCGSAWTPIYWQILQPYMSRKERLWTIQQHALGFNEVAFKPLFKGLKVRVHA